jgi:cobalt-precorrin 5A hydrolase
VVMDQRGEFIISLISGHLGGGNDLARQVATAVGGQAVITTATDTEGLPSIDLLALRAGLHLHNPSVIRKINAALLADKHVGLYDTEGWLLQSLHPAEQIYFQILPHSAALTNFVIENSQAPRVQVTWQEADPSENCLTLIPPALCVGIGCRKGVLAQEVLQLVRKVCMDNGIALKAIGCLASADIKAEEPGLMEAAQALGVPLRTFNSAELAIYPPQNISPKASSALGLAGVCEPAARCAARGGPLLIGKQTLGRVTLAMAVHAPKATQE